MKEITISMEEYKELLIIKGKYEELKSQTTKPVTTPLIREPLTLTKKPIEYYDTTITCKGENNG